MAQKRAVSLAFIWFAGIWFASTTTPYFLQAPLFSCQRSGRKSPALCRLGNGPGSILRLMFSPNGLPPGGHDSELQICAKNRAGGTGRGLTPPCFCKADYQTFVFYLVTQLLKTDDRCAGIFDLAAPQTIHQHFEPAAHNQRIRHRQIPRSTTNLLDDPEVEILFLLREAPLGLIAV